MLGAAAGAVGAAGLAAGQFLVHGAQAGARSAWSGAAARTPALEVSLPRPASLPPPLPVEPSSSSRARRACPRARRQRGGGSRNRPQDDRLKDFENRTLKLTELVETQTAAVAKAAQEAQHEREHRK